MPEHKGTVGEKVGVNVGFGWTVSVNVVTPGHPEDVAVVKVTMVVPAVTPIIAVFVALGVVKLTIDGVAVQVYVVPIPGLAAIPKPPPTHIDDGGGAPVTEGTGTGFMGTPILAV